MTRIPLVAALAGAALLAGCATPRAAAPSAAPDVPFAGKAAPLAASLAPAAPAAASAEQPGRAPAAEPQAPPAGRPAALAELIDLGLARHPDTRAAWLAARSSAASAEAARAALYPRADVVGSANRVRALLSGAGPDTSTENVYGATVNVSWLLLDFGGRRATIEGAGAALEAANWQHNAAIADRVLAVARAYRALQGAEALAAAQRAAVESAKTGLAAAEDRRASGVATLADVLQARTALSRAELQAETYDGQEATARGALNDAAGLPVDARTIVDPLPADLAGRPATEAVDALVAEAARRRPEVQAAEANARRAEANVRAVKSDGLPQLSLVGSGGRTWYEDPSFGANTYTLGLALRFPAFTGFAQKNNERRAEIDAEQARAKAESARRAAELDVFRSFHNVNTAARRLGTSADLVASARQNHDAALARYKAGVGSIVELLSAQSALEDARAQEVQARADWLAALAQLARDRGANLPSITKDARP